MRLNELFQFTSLKLAWVHCSRSLYLRPPPPVGLLMLEHDRLGKESHACSQAGTCAVSIRLAWLTAARSHLC